VTWEEVLPDRLHRLVASVTRAGGNVLLGATRDRSSWSVTVWHPQLGDKPKSEYCNSTEMFPEFVEDLANLWESIADELEGEQEA